LLSIARKSDYAEIGSFQSERVGSQLFNEGRDTLSHRFNCRTGHRLGGVEQEVDRQSARVFGHHLLQLDSECGGLAPLSMDNKKFIFEKKAASGRRTPKEP
jgi:hypothetical protein